MGWGLLNCHCFWDPRALVKLTSSTGSQGPVGINRANMSVMSVVQVRETEMKRQMCRHRDRQVDTETEIQRKYSKK